MAGEAYSKRYGAGFVDLPTQTTSIDSQFLNSVEAALVRLLGADPTDDCVQVWDAGLGRFKTIKLTASEISPTAGIAKSQLAPLAITDADIAAGANIAGSKIGGNIPISKLANYPANQGKMLRGDASWGPVRLVSGTNTSPITTAGTTFAAGADALAAALTFTADGTSSYLVRCQAASWNNNTSGGANELHLNLDGADAGILARGVTAAANQWMALSGHGIITPAIGSHTVNARLITPTGGGTATIQAQGGGAGNYFPLLLWVELL